MNELAVLQLDIYPNPANTQITITANSKLKDVQVNSTIGQLVLHQHINKEKVELNIAHLQPGIYFVTVTDAGGAKLTRKIVKE